MDSLDKSKKLHLFNPENDVCLGIGNRSYNMPHMVRELHVSGAALPLWWSDEGDMVYAPEVSRKWLDGIKSQFPVYGNLYTVGNNVKNYSGEPWGWSYDARKQLSITGCEVISDDKIEKIRNLSHRRTSIAILEKIKEASIMLLPPLPQELYSVEEALEVCDAYPVTYFKAPWSSSGRGVMEVSAMTVKDESRIASIIKKQGSVIAEKGLVKKQDFAMLFNAFEGRIKFVGYSVFFNDHGNAYGGNLLGSNDYLKQMLIDDGASSSQLTAIELHLTKILEDIIGDAYNGYLGVDMLLDADNNIMPCVELNLRMTMGVVARLFHDRYMDTDRCGTYSVTPVAQSISSPVIKNGKLTGGELSLAPGETFSFIVKVL